MRNDGPLTARGGAYKTCPNCGRTFFCTDVDRWAYKRSVSKGGSAVVRHFCKWSCLLAFDKEYEEKKAEARRKAGWKRGMKKA